MGTKFKTRHRGRSPGSTDFGCVHCGQIVTAEAYGTSHRNHCPHCLWSRHVDRTPGDRAAGCDGAMEPIAIWVKRDGEWSIVHRCGSCGEIHSNRIAGDDNEWALMALAARALSQPPFPIE